MPCHARRRITGSQLDVLGERDAASLLSALTGTFNDAQALARVTRDAAGRTRCRPSTGNTWEALASRSM